MNRAAAFALVVVLSVGLAPGHADAVVLADQEAAELHEILAEAQKIQKVCYSYSISINDYDGNESGVERANSWSTVRRDSPIPAGVCDRHVELKAYVMYTSAGSEGEDSASYVVNVFVVPDIRTDPEMQNKIGNDAISGQDQLLRDPGEAVFNKMRALPGMVATTGLRPYLPLEVNTAPLAPGDGLDSDVGSDFWRTKWPTIAMFAVGLVAAIAWAGYIVVRDRWEKRLVDQHEPTIEKT